MSICNKILTQYSLTLYFTLYLFMTQINFYALKPSCYVKTSINWLIMPKIPGQKQNYRVFTVNKIPWVFQVSGKPSKSTYGKYISASAIWHKYIRPVSRVFAVGRNSGHCSVRSLQCTENGQLSQIVVIGGGAHGVLMAGRSAMWLTERNTAASTAHALGDRPA